MEDLGYREWTSMRPDLFHCRGRSGRHFSLHEMWSRFTFQVRVAALVGCPIDESDDQISRRRRRSQNRPIVLFADCGQITGWSLVVRRLAGAADDRSVQSAFQFASAPCSHRATNCGSKREIRAEYQTPRTDARYPDRLHSIE